MSQTKPPRVTARSRFKALARALLATVSIVYLLGLIATALALRFIGEGWWITLIGLYLPRYLFLIPLPFLFAGALLLRARKLAWTQVAAALVVLFPLMGLVLPTPAPRADGPTLRVLSFNVNSGFWGFDRILPAVLEQSPDIALFQEISLINEPAKFEEGLRKQYPHVQWDGQFMIASRFPILSKVNPEKLEFYGKQRSARFMQYLVDTPLGKLSVFNVHPISPRAGFHTLRGKAGLRRSLLSGEFFTGEGPKAVIGHHELLALQLKDVAERARRETHPVVIAGDLNLPTLGRSWETFFSGFQDGFESAGSGFGYTFPHRKGLLQMWLRLDRIVAGPELAFVDFETACTDASDHLCVVAELQRR